MFKMLETSFFFSSKRRKNWNSENLFFLLLDAKKNIVKIIK